MDWCNRHKDRHTIVGTDVQCKWDKPRKASKPSTTNHVDFRRQTEPARPPKPTPEEFSALPPAQAFNERQFERDVVRMLKNCNPEACALNVLSGSDSSGSDTESETELAMPTMSELKFQYGDFTTEQDIFSFLSTVMNKTKCDNIENATREQEEDGEWMRMRKGRITASTVHNILHAKPETWSNPDNYIVTGIIHGRSIDSNSINHGKSNEDTARETYKSVGQHENLQVQKSGLVINKSYAHLGASPDGIVTCDCCNERLLEIKCPYTHMNDSIDKICEDTRYHLYKDNNIVKLKTSSSWYTQIQMQMFITGYTLTDLAIYTKVAPFVTVITIPYDNDWFLQQLPIINKFFLNLIWPKL